MKMEFVSNCTTVNNVSINDTKIDELNVKHFDKICRTCLSLGEFKSIFQLSFENVSFKNLFKTCVSISIAEDDDLPRNICDNCISDMVHSYSFINKCRHSNDTLQLIVNNKNARKSSVELEQSGESIKDEDESSLRNIDEFVQAQSDAASKETEEAAKADEANAVEDIFDEFIQTVFENECEKDFKTKTRTEAPANTCTTCGIQFSTKDELNKHTRETKHPRPRNHVCPICGKAFEYAHLKQHMRTHTKEKPYQCVWCSMKFSLKGNLRRHIRRHTGEKPHKCEICDKGFIQAPSLREHMRLHTGERPFVCSYCGRRFTQSGQHKLHLRRHEMQSEGGKPPITYECETCSKTFASHAALKMHITVHGHKRFLCNLCGKGFVSNAGLQSHLKVHTGVKPYSCEVCGKMFAHYGSIKSHLLTHTGERAFTCSLCSKSFTQCNHLKYHMRTHSGERPYVCSYCGKSFSLNGTLKVHVRIHTGETPYKCDICGKGFHASNSMKKHRKTHEEIVLTTTKEKDTSPAYEFDF